MITTDPIADMLTRIRNASSSKHKTVDVPSSNVKLAIAKILFEEGYIKSFEEIKEENNQGIIRITLNGLGIALISTSKGIMTDKAARAAGLGGEVLAYIW